MDTLIVYATKHGSTEKCAKMLSEKLSGNIDLYNLKDVKDLNISKYDRVIIGGSIHIGKIQKEISEFCSKNLDILKGKNLGLFICCMQKDDVAIEQLNNAFPQELLSNAKTKEVFGGEFLFKKMNPLEKFMVKMVSKEDIDTKKDISNIIYQNVDRFVQQME